jgi:hypothetical protein
LLKSSFKSIGYIIVLKHKKLIFTLFFSIITILNNEIKTMSNLYIPSKIKVGFQERSDTFTGKLAYVIYFDEKGKLRKETSWENWRDTKIEAIEIDNTPRSGYLFNKGVQRGGYDWGTGRSSIRVYDPRDFEFEITVDNLMGILMHSDVSKRDIVEECVFAWEGKELVLLPVNSEEYQASVVYTAKQAEKFSAKNLVKGYVYNQKKSEEPLVYVGYFEWFDWGHEKHRDYDSPFSHRVVGKKHVFYDEKTKNFSTPAISALSSVNSEEVVENYASIVDDFFKLPNSQPIVGVKVVPFKEKYNYGYFYKADNNKIEKIYIYFNDYRKEDTFTHADYHAQKYELTFANRKATRIDASEPNQNSNYSGYNKVMGSIEKGLRNKAVELGFNLKDMTLEKVYQTCEAENYGKLVFVLENGNTCDTYNF